MTSVLIIRGLTLTQRSWVVTVLHPVRFVRCRGSYGPGDDWNTIICIIHRILTCRTAEMSDYICSLKVFSREREG